MGLAPTLSQQWASWYTETIAGLTELAGRGGDDPVSGTTMPNLSAIGTLALLGLVTPSMVSLIDRFNRDYNGRGVGHGAIRSDMVDSEGVVTASGEELEYATAFVSARDYLSFSTFPLVDTQLPTEHPWRRFPRGKVGWEAAVSYEPYIASHLFRPTETTVLNFLRQTIHDYQRMATACASAIYTNSADTTQPAPYDDLSEFLAALRALCGSLDVMNETIPENNSIKDALREALAKSSEFVGKAAADVADEVGKTAGIVGANLTEGFLTNAGILSFVVVGIALHLFLK